MKTVRVVLMAFALGASALAHAGLFDDEEARKNIAATQARLDGLQRTLDARLAAIEQQGKGQAMDLVRDLEGIKSDVAKIRGQIEVLTYEIGRAHV